MGQHGSIARLQRRLHHIGAQTVDERRHGHLRARVGHGLGQARPRPPEWQRVPHGRLRAFNGGCAREAHHAPDGIARLRHRVGR